jgi:membrane fusion protein, multidrug efflux system
MVPPQVGLVALSNSMKVHLFAVLLLVSLSTALRAEPTDGLVLPFKFAGVNSPVLQELIAEIPVKEGDEVREGQIIVQLRNEREKLDVQLSEKLIELKRFSAAGHEKLFKEKAGSEEKALEARTDLELAILQKTAKEIALQEKSIRASFSGVIVKKYKEVGEAVDRSEKILEIMNYDQVFIQFYVKPELRKTLKVQAPAKVKIKDLDSAEFHGKIEFIDPRNEAASGFILIKVLVDNKDHQIKPGMKATGEFAP